MSETVAAIEVANAPGAKRPLVFISHATPQDNEFVLWLGTRLTALGYEVWADILKLRGGQDWTELLEVALKDWSAKLLLVATPDGLSKKGVQREIKLAQQVAAKLGDTSFIIPLRKERYELTFDTALAQYIDFTENWGAGLVELTKTLQEYNVPRSGPSPEVAANWRGLIDNERAPVEIAEERPVSNALSITSLPKTVGIYQAAFAGRDLVDAALRAVTLPHVRIGDCLVGFCFPGDYTAQLNGALSFNVRYEIPWGEFARDGFPALGVSGIDARRHLISLLRQHWDAYCACWPSLGHLAPRVAEVSGDRAQDVPRPERHVGGDARQHMDRPRDEEAVAAHPGHHLDSPNALLGVDQAQNWGVNLPLHALRVGGRARRRTLSRLVLLRQSPQG